MSKVYYHTLRKSKSIKINLLFAVPASKIRERCPDCPTQLSKDHEEIEKTMKMAMEKYNKESGLANYFVPLNVTRASGQVSEEAN